MSKIISSGGDYQEKILRTKLPNSKSLGNVCIKKPKINKES